MRKNLKVVRLGDFVFNGEEIYIQSMLKKAAEDVAGNVRQAQLLNSSGCQIIRVALPTIESVQLIKALKKNVCCPIVADIHFNYKIAIEAVKQGADKIRINPGNITKKEELKSVVDVCKAFKVPIRIGVNSGSLEKSLLEVYGSASVDAMVQSALNSVNMFENYFDFSNLVVSIKSSSVADTVAACRKFRSLCNYPLHIGVTEAGLNEFSVIKSAIGIGSLLLDGIGETLRVSITGDPLQEVQVGKLILKALNINKKGVNIISCPTCGRTKIDIFKLTKEVQKRLENCNKNINVAIMGCVVNGPGEAKEADIGIAGGDGCAVLFKKGKICAKLDERDIVNALLNEIENM